ESTRIIGISANQLHVLVGRALPLDLGRANHTIQSDWSRRRGLASRPNHSLSCFVDVENHLGTRLESLCVPNSLRNGYLPLYRDSRRHNTLLPLTFVLPQLSL